ncbi:hypothetical protein Y032_0286g1396 [Ancylostoma ceylanicum]|uniref:Uncharacterized protein n=1 Tax=Ancylostoma ceylanicum TaxID=53326 RepID=A0A016S5Y6_9BILA|nr:hypothetical protein Y032_0286g1396 [Ancylostoma ceylanicum]
MISKSNHSGCFTFIYHTVSASVSLQRLFRLLQFQFARLERDQGMPLKIADEHAVGGSDDLYGRAEARQNRQKELRKDGKKARSSYNHPHCRAANRPSFHANAGERSDMMIFFIPLGVVLCTSLVLELVAIFYSRTLAKRERAAEAAAARKQDTVTEGSNSEDLSERSAMGIEPDDSFFKA